MEEIIVIRCMDRRGGKRLDQKKKTESAQGRAVYELALGGAEVESVYDDVDSRIENGDVVRIDYMPHGSTEPGIKGCGAVATAQQVARGQRETSERLKERYVQRLEGMGVELEKLSSSEAETAIARAEMNALEEHLKKRGLNVPIVYSPMAFGKEDEQHGEKLAVMFRFPTTRTMEADLEALKKTGTSLKQEDTYLVSCGNPERALVSLEMAVSVIGAKDIFLVATNDREFNALSKFQDTLAREPFMNGASISLRKIDGNRSKIKI
ncbi:MAG TPA: hypothetical protein VL944_02935 [Candidatus Acidoferrum sp.]|nr:hypothetical protein [Candidatus Acidoferrum sp.]